MTDTRQRLLFAGIIALLIVAADQITKYMVLVSVPLDTGYEVVPGFMNIVHARNSGAAFSIFSGLSRWFFIAVSIVAILVISWILITTRQLDRILFTGYSLFIGGALGNLIDRIRFGQVIDFLELYAGSFHWPAFNVADSALSVGTACFFIHILTSKGK